MKKIKQFITFCCLLITTSTLAQEKFSDEILNNINKYGANVEKSFQITETSNFEIDTNNRIILKNGLRSSKYLNPDSWESIKEEVKVNSISIVFSKYPIRKNGYSMNHKLLFNRLKNLFLIDPLLNNSLINWNIILHTNCKNEIQVDSLFHGIIIEYKKLIDAPKVSNLASHSINYASGVIETIIEFNDFPEDILLDTKGRNPLDKTEIIINYFEELLKDSVATEFSPDFLKTQIDIIKQFIRTYGSNNDTIVYTVFDRNRKWKNALIVADWTGSMYQHGAQALLWHALNFKTSGLEYFTLFNDGDLKPTKSKKLGETGGIYFEKADNIDKIIKLYQLIMLKGEGGDGPENDIEGILKGIEKYPMHSEIILIADNNACVRDMELLEYIDKPVRVIICGYNNMWGINPQYLHIAKETGGSLHTMDFDIHNLQVELNKKGVINSLIGYDFKIGSSDCYNLKSVYTESNIENRVYTNIESVESFKKRVVFLDLSSQSIQEIPTKIGALKKLEILDLSDNSLSELPKQISRLRKLKTLRLSGNNFSNDYIEYIKKILPNTTIENK